jgi:hypothetical protein
MFGQFTRHGTMMAIALALLVIAKPVQAGSAGNGYPKSFPSEAGAQQYCPKDVVVWAGDPSNRSFYMKGSPSYATVKGYYACMKDAQFHRYVPH